MFSSNIIERHQAVQNLLTDPINVYFLMVAGLLVASWRLAKWL